MPFQTDKLAAAFSCSALSSSSLSFTLCKKAIDGPIELPLIYMPSVTINHAGPQAHEFASRCSDARKLSLTFSSSSGTKFALWCEMIIREQIRMSYWQLAAFFIIYIINDPAINSTWSKSFLSLSQRKSTEMGKRGMMDCWITLSPHSK